MDQLKKNLLLEKKGINHFHRPMKWEMIWKEENKIIPLSYIGLFFSPNLTISVCCIYFLKIKFLVSRMSFGPFSVGLSYLHITVILTNMSLAWQLASVGMPSTAQSNSHADSFLNFLYWILREMQGTSGFLTYLCLNRWSDNVFIEEMQNTWGVNI